MIERDRARSAVGMRDWPPKIKALCIPTPVNPMLVEHGVGLV
jgi:hypothetical protein